MRRPQDRLGVGDVVDISRRKGALFEDDSPEAWAGEAPQQEDQEEPGEAPQDDPSLSSPGLSDRIGPQDLKLALGVGFFAATAWNLTAGPTALAERAVYTDPTLATTASRNATIGLWAAVAVGGGALLVAGRRGLAAAGTAAGLGLGLWALSRWQVTRAALDGAQAIAARRVAEAGALGVAAARSASGAPVTSRSPRGGVTAVSARDTEPHPVDPAEEFFRNLQDGRDGDNEDVNIVH